LSDRITKIFKNTLKLVFSDFSLTKVLVSNTVRNMAKYHWYLFMYCLQKVLLLYRLYKNYHQEYCRWHQYKLQYKQD